VPLTYVNEQFEQITGYTESEILGRNCRFLQGEGTDPEPVAALREAIENEERVSVTLRNYRKDGTAFWNRVSVAPVRDETGAATSFIGFQEDVTRQREREQTLETLHTAATRIQACESVEAACRRTVEAAEDVLEFELCSVMVHREDYLDPIAMSTEAPPDGARRMDDDHGLAGKTFQEGRSFVIDEVGSDNPSDPAKETYRSGLSVPIGEHGVFQTVSTQPADFDESDRRLAELLVAHTARTIDRLEFESELRESKAELQRRNERLSRFAGLVSHDLRNPLNVASGRLELERETGDSDHLRAVAEAHDRMDELIEDLLTLAREGSPIEEAEPVDLKRFAGQCWENVATAESTLVVEADRRVQADPDRLKQLLENLMRNAVEHGGEAVRVTVDDIDGGFYVEDDGPGISPNDREDVFEYGFSTTEGGTGFGLAIVKEIAESHDWTVSATEGEDGGARFEFTGVERPDGE
jgi:PAS domain S-box-containing protein